MKQAVEGGRFSRRRAQSFLASAGLLRGRWVVSSTNSSRSDVFKAAVTGAMEPPSGAQVRGSSQPNDGRQRLGLNGVAVEPISSSLR